MIPVPTCSAATSLMQFFRLFLTKTTSIIPTSRMIRTCGVDKGKKKIKLVPIPGVFCPTSMQIILSSLQQVPTTHSLVLGFRVQTPLHSFHPQLLFGRVHVEESLSAEIQLLKTEVMTVNILFVNKARKESTSRSEKCCSSFLLTQEHKDQEVLSHSRAMVQGCCLETGRSRSTYL